ncbi:MAG: polyribonucleotide nucleotidyltransferase [Planctomycetota bacterium]|nr:MAG: polyribonucleotide nucleotidyltransferase [Planctomycetota bacterium]
MSLENFVHLSKPSSFSWEVEGERIMFETGRIAKQANGAVVLRYREAFLLATATAATQPSEGIDFVPLSVEYREKFASAGRIPGGFLRREGRITDEEVLTSRLVDRSIRPLFPKDYRYETQVLVHVFSTSEECDTEPLAILAASVALYISDIPWGGPVGGVRVCRIGGEFRLFSSLQERERADLDLVISCSPEGLIMLEGGGKEVEEREVLEAMEFAQRGLVSFFERVSEWGKEVGRPKRALLEDGDRAAVEARAEEIGRRWEASFAEAFGFSVKKARRQALERLREEVLEAYRDLEGEGFDAGFCAKAFELAKSGFMRAQILRDRRRIDGRGMGEIRPIEVEVGILPGAHGSSLFTRGETQALVTCTLGMESESQVVETIFGEGQRYFLLHYNFPPYCVGEVRPMRGPGRREIGHGNLARRALLPVIPSRDAFPYTIRVVSDITESNGSSSMATVCGASMALMDAGVPISKPVAGIAMGLVCEGEEVAILSDILGDEDHLGDMDFKVAGTRDGITAVQMDNKLGSVERSVLERALQQAREGRLSILETMSKTLGAHRQELSEHAPQVASLQICPETVRQLIGPKGKTIQQIQQDTETSIEVSENGRVRIYGRSRARLQEARELVEYHTAQVEVGKYYEGEVSSIRDFGAFVRIYAHVEGLIHISEIDHKRVQAVEDYLRVGEKVVVKVLGVDRKGRLSLSRKEGLHIQKECVENWKGRM